MNMTGSFRFLGGYAKEVNDKTYYNATIIQDGKTEQIGVTEDAYKVMQELEQYTGTFRFARYKDRAHLTLLSVEAK